MCERLILKMTTIMTISHPHPLLQRTTVQEGAVLLTGLITITLFTSVYFNMCMCERLILKMTTIMTISHPHPLLQRTTVQEGAVLLTGLITITLFTSVYFNICMGERLILKMTTIMTISHPHPLLQRTTVQEGAVLLTGLITITLFTSVYFNMCMCERLILKMTTIMTISHPHPLLQRTTVQEGAVLLTGLITITLFTSVYFNMCMCERLILKMTTIMTISHPHPLLQRTTVQEGAVLLTGLITITLFTSVYFNMCMCERLILKMTTIMTISHPHPLLQRTTVQEGAVLLTGLITITLFTSVYFNMCMCERLILKMTTIMTISHPHPLLQRTTVQEGAVLLTGLITITLFTSVYLNMCMCERLILKMTTIMTISHPHPLLQRTTVQEGAVLLTGLITITLFTSVYLNMCMCERLILKMTTIMTISHPHPLLQRTTVQEGAVLLTGLITITLFTSVYFNMCMCERLILKMTTIMTISHPHPLLQRTTVQEGAVLLTGLITITLFTSVYLNMCMCERLILKMTTIMTISHPHPLLQRTTVQEGAVLLTGLITITLFTSVYFNICMGERLILKMTTIMTISHPHPLLQRTTVQEGAVLLTGLITITLFTSVYFNMCMGERLILKMTTIMTISHPHPLLQRTTVQEGAVLLTGLITITLFTSVYFNMCMCERLILKMTTIMMMISTNTNTQLPPMYMRVCLCIAFSLSIRFPVMAVALVLLFTWLSCFVSTNIIKI